MARTASYDRDTVLDRARDLFWEKGIEGTSLKDLEAALDLRPGSIYAGFGSKSGLARAALERYAATGLAGFAERRATHPPLEALAVHLDAIAQQVPPRACLLMKTVVGNDPDLAAKATELADDTEAAFAAAFAAALPHRSDTADLARWYQAQVFGLRAYAERAPGPAATMDVAARMAAAVRALR
jgi:AcrR family transcriptional regulator